MNGGRYLGKYNFISYIIGLTNTWRQLRKSRTNGEQMSYAEAKHYSYGHNPGPASYLILNIACFRNVSIFKRTNPSIR